jgi:hypothetical protein
MRSLALLLAIVVFFTGCSDAENHSSRDVEVAGTGDIKKISYSHLDGFPYINAWPVNGTLLEALAHLNIFDGFEPCMTFDDTRKRYGLPDSQRTLPNRTEIELYRRDLAEVGVAREPINSGGAQGAAFWRVYAFPRGKGIDLTAIVKKETLDQLQLPQSPYELVLLDGTTSEESLWITVASNRIQQLRWVKNCK